MSNLLEQLVLIFSVRLVWPTFHQLCVPCVSTASPGTAHSSRRITRSVRVFARQLQPRLDHPCLGLVLYSIQRPDHIPSEVVPLVFFDMVRNSAWGCGCSYHHDPCNPCRVFVHPHNLKQYIPPHALVTFSPCQPSSYGRPYLLHCHCGELVRQWNPRPRSRYCPVFHLYRCGPCFLESCLRSDVWRPSRASTSRLMLSRPVI
jgi:hypothetical protein